MFAFEGVAVVAIHLTLISVNRIFQIMPIENRMSSPHAFISWNGVLNSSCLVVLAIFSVTGFYG